MSGDFPIPYKGQMPNDDLAHAVSVLKLIGRQFEQAADRGLDSDEVHDLYVALDIAKDTLRPIQRYLDALDYPGMLEGYQDARRADILERGGASDE